MSAIIWIFFTVFWGVVGALLGSFVPNGPNKGVIQIGLSLTAACCYTIWACCYMAQMNPLFGPQLNSVTHEMLRRQ